MTAIRPLAEDDADAVVELSLRAWEPVFASFVTVLGDELYTRIYPDWRAHQAADVRRALADNATWVSADGSAVTGFVNVIFDTAEASGEIYMIAVDPEHQRREIATELTGHALAEMRARGLTLASVGTGLDPGHAPARRTYEKAGFTPFPQVTYFRLLE